MKQVLLGKSGLTVSEMCLGAMMFGTTVDKETSFMLLDAFADMGGTFVDTSNNYAPVSYTHLDVYKRQRLHGMNAHALVHFPMSRHPGGISPVQIRATENAREIG